MTIDFWTNVLSLEWHQCQAWFDTGCRPGAFGLPLNYLLARLFCLICALKRFQSKLYMFVTWDVIDSLKFVVLHADRGLQLSLEALPDLCRPWSGQDLIGGCWTFAGGHHRAQRGGAAHINCTNCKSSLGHGLFFWEGHVDVLLGGRSTAQSSEVILRAKRLLR